MPRPRKNTTEITETQETAPQIVQIAWTNNTIDQDTLNMLLDGYKKQKELEDKISKLESKDQPVLKNEEYLWPKKYRYKLYARIVDNKEVLVPILSYRSIKNDPAQDWVFQNQYGSFTNNQSVMLTLQWGEEVKEPIQTLLRAERSEYVFPKYLEDKEGNLINGQAKLTGQRGFAKDIQAYIFENEKGEFRVVSSCIN